MDHPAALMGLGSSIPASGKGTTSGQQRQLGAFARQAKYQCDSNQWLALTDSVIHYLVEESFPFVCKDLIH